MASAQRILRSLAGRFRDTQADGKVYALQNGALLDVTNITQKALSAVPLSVTSAGQTQFTVPGGYTPGLLQVARNGILQSFTGTNGTSITLASGTSGTSDTVTAYVFATFQVANALMLSGGTMTGQLLSPGITMSGSFNAAPIASLASAATVSIGAAPTNSLTITGTTTITAFDAVASGVVKTLTFSGALILTHNSASLILPYGSSITTAAGDVARFLSLGSGNWRCIGYQRAAAAAVRSDLGLGTAAIMNALGTVVPGANNGALIEYGSNANGRYFRFFGGLQICIGVPGPRTTVVTSSVGNIGYFGAAGSLTYPAGFANEIPVYIPSLTSIQNYFGLCPYDSEGTLTTTPYTYVWSPSSSFSARVGYVAIGRFY